MTAFYMDVEGLVLSTLCIVLHNQTTIILFALGRNNRVWYSGQQRLVQVAMILQWVCIGDRVYTNPVITPRYNNLF